jgi:hypothetical protein
MEPYPVLLICEQESAFGDLFGGITTLRDKAGVLV